jgi:hypothetical protein
MPMERTFRRRKCRKLSHVETSQIVNTALHALSSILVVISQPVKECSLTMAHNILNSKGDTIRTMEVCRFRVLISFQMVTVIHKVSSINNNNLINNSSINSNKHNSINRETFHKYQALTIMIYQHSQHDSFPSTESSSLIQPQQDQPIQSVPSAIAPVFVPMGMNMGMHMASPPAPSQFGLSPLSPSMLAGSLPSIPPAEAFFAGPGSPPTNIMSPPNPFIPNGHIRSHSFSQQQQLPQPFIMPTKGFHGKKPSFSGGPRPFAPRASIGGPGAGIGGSGANLGAWKDGVPPPCAFFVQGKCRNGELCKFPHLDEQGNDCEWFPADVIMMPNCSRLLGRHPDVIRGIIPPLPSLARQPRGMRMGMGMGPGGNFGSFDPSFRAQQQQQQLLFIQQQRQAAAQAHQNGIEEVTPSAETATATPVNGSPEKPTLPSSVPAKPTAAPTNPAAPLPAIVRSASQPGIARVHANGYISRSHSPAPSNVSFHGNGHPRRAGSRVPFPNGGVNGHVNGNGDVNGNASGRSASTERHATGRPPQPQRVPRADEFPALGGAPTSPNGAQQVNGKTAAQVLSAPAPVKVTPAKAEDAEDEGSASGQSDQNVSTHLSCYENERSDRC